LLAARAAGEMNAPSPDSAMRSSLRCFLDIRRIAKKDTAGFLLSLILMLGGRSVEAAPHIPASDSSVLERVPAVAATQKLEPLRTRLAADPEDLQSALALAQGYLDIGRANADPRFVSYAQATLTPWLSRPHPDVAVLTLAATTLQYLHRFAEALTLLNQALAIQKLNGQAWLTKATSAGN
jgi:hypothetical protein